MRFLRLVFLTLLLSMLASSFSTVSGGEFGVFRSTDDGGSWRRVFDLQDSVNAVIITPRSAILAATGLSASPERYYFDITRPDCCRLSDKDWQRIATTLRARGIPTFFGIYDVLNYREHWRPVKLRRTQPSAGWLILGPFDSAASAMRVLQRLPKLLPNRMGGEDERSRGVQPDPFGYSQHWVIGMYQIGGFKTSLPIGTQKQEVLTPGTLEGVVVEKLEGANWWGVVVESNGLRYSIQLGGNSGGVRSQSGDVETVGNRVRITYKTKRKENDGTYFLDATRIVQVRKNVR